jgi:hypothetical protein
LIAGIWKSKAIYDYRSQLTVHSLLFYAVFDIYDDDFDGVVGIKYLGTMLRAIGLIMTDADIVNIEKDADPEKRGEVELGYFFVIAARRFRDQDSIELAAKKAFSKMSKSTLISGMWYNNLQVCEIFANATIQFISYLYAPFCIKQCYFFLKVKMIYKYLLLKLC